MGLRNITIHQTTVPYRDQEIAVRGISSTDLMVAAQDYGPEIAMTFAKIQSGGLTGDVRDIIKNLAREVPDVAGAVIALATDDYAPETVETATKLPFPTQVALIEAIFHETFYSEAEVKKLIESLTRMIAAVSGAMTQLELPSDLISGIGASAGKPAS
jgi:hypothetical protein